MITKEKRKRKWKAFQKDVARRTEINTYQKDNNIYGLDKFTILEEEVKDMQRSYNYIKTAIFIF